MFKFGFTANNTIENHGGENEINDTENNASMDWFPAKKIEISSEQLAKKLDDYDITEIDLSHDITLKLVITDKVVIDLQHENCKNIIEAESQHSDLLPGKYEGGLKIWECSYDLAKYLLGEKIGLKNKSVIDLGCGAGIIGILALLKGANYVHFQDYNAEVIKSVTIPNVILNGVDKNEIANQCGFFSGDWESFSELSNEVYQNSDDHCKYDLILTSETIYNPDNQRKLYNVFKNKLKKNGTVYVAGKIYYFGVGGGMRQFEDLVKKEKLFDVETVWRSEEGIQREILKLTFKN